MRSNDPQLKLRIPRSLKTQIEKAARAANRSLNGEIVSRLEQSFKDGQGGSSNATASEVAIHQPFDISPQLEQRLTMIEHRLGRLESYKNG